MLEIVSAAVLDNMGVLLSAAVSVMSSSTECIAIDCDLKCANSAGCGAFEFVEVTGFCQLFRSSATQIVVRTASGSVVGVRPGYTGVNGFNLLFTFWLLFKIFDFNY